MSEFRTEPGVPDTSMTTQAQDKVRETTQQASQKAAEYLRQQTETRAAQAGQELRALADAMRRSGHALHAEGKQTSGAAVDTVVGRLERLSSYLGGTSGDRMLGDLESFGRRKPWGMVGLGLGLGLAASRLLKASSQRRYQTAQPQVPAQPPAPPAPPPLARPAQDPVGQLGATVPSAD